MKALKDYIRTEWIYWVGTFLFILAFSALSDAVASPTALTNDKEIVFVQDDDGSWFARYNSTWNYIGDNSDYLKSVWKGKVDKSPVALTVSRSKDKPGVTYRFLVIAPNGGVKSMPPIYKEKPASVLVKAGYPITRIYLSGVMTEFNLAQ